MSENDVFCFWRNLDGSDNIPPYINLCLKSIQKYHHNVELITPETLSVDVPKTWYNRIPAHQADLLRPRYLKKYGGLFVDIDTIFFRNFFESEFFDKTKEMIGFSYRKYEPTIGVLYAKKGSSLMDKWEKNQDKHLNSHNNWTLFGKDSLWNIKFGDEYMEFDAKYIQPFRWTETRKFNSEIKIDNDKLACALFNKVLPENIKVMTEEDLLSSENLIGQLFRKALKI